jgi:hypothetical protein
MVYQFPVLNLCVLEGEEVCWQVPHMQTQPQGVEQVRKLVVGSAFLQETKLESQSCPESRSLVQRDSVAGLAVGMWMAAPVRSRKDELQLLAILEPRGM